MKSVNSDQRTNNFRAGISKEVQGKVFEPFFLSNLREKERTMIGRIEKIITVGHGGKLFLDSTPGQGTTSTIVLPINRSI